MRVEARRLREKLRDYYDGGGVDDQVRIRLPKGGYHPVFEWNRPPVPQAADAGRLDSGTPPAASTATVREVQGRLPRPWSLYAGVVVAVCAALWSLAWREGAAEGAPPVTTVAVAAFDDFTASPADAAFATGLAEDIETALARVPGLRVLSRRATRALGPSPAPQDVGRRLDAGSVLQGSVRVADGNVRVSARLLRTTDGSSLWARSFDAPRQQAFALQDALAASIATTLRGALLSQATPPARTVNAEAQTRLWNGRDPSAASDP